jgi:hypothetical protein
MHFGLKALLNDPESAKKLQNLVVSSQQSKSSSERPAVEESAMRSLINICEWLSETKMKV